MRENKESEKGGSLIRMYNVGEHYKILQKVGRGTYGTVYKARGLRDNKFYAIKKLENNDVKLQQEGFPITALREITLLKQIDHPNIIKLKEIILSRPSKRNLFRGSTFLVTQYMDHDFAGLFKMRRKFNLPEIKCIFKQLIEGVAYLHRNKILHRDIKSANILLNDEGELKIADFGLGRKVRMENVFTYKVVTLWYRAPELLWGFKHYSDKIDVWSIGCVAVQFFTGEVLFKKESQHAQIERIYEICGDFEANDLRISEEAAKSYQYLADMRPKKPYKRDIAGYLRKMCPHISEITVEFIEGLLNLDPNKRLTCEEALRHPFFNEKPTACQPRDIQKQEYECHEMFKDRSIKIQRTKKDQLDMGKMKTSGKQERGFRQYHSKRDKQHSMTSQSKNRQFSSSQSSSNTSNDQSQSYHQKSKRSSRSKSRSARKRSKSREERESRNRRHGYHEHKHRDRDNDSRRERDRPYHREVREDRKDRRDETRDYKLEKDRRVEEKDDKYYHDKHDKRYKEPRRKEDRYNRFDERVDERRDGKEDRRTAKDDRRETREGKHERRSAKEERRDTKDERREVKDERRQLKDERREGKDERREGKDERREGKDDRREKDERRGERHHDYKRQSKQKKFDKYQKPKYESRPYEAKAISKHRPFQDQKDYKRRQQRRLQRRQDREKGRQERDNGHQNGKYQASKQKYSNDYRGAKKAEKFIFVRQKGHRKKQASSSSSGSSYSSHHFKKQKQHRSKYSYDRKAYYKKQHSSSGSRGYH